jgi:hypothetical protein
MSNKTRRDIEPGEKIYFLAIDDQPVAGNLQAVITATDYEVAGLEIAERYGSDKRPLPGTKLYLIQYDGNKHHLFAPWETYASPSRARRAVKYWASQKKTSSLAA